MATTANPKTAPLLSLLLVDLDAELASTRRVLQSFPAGKGDWKPHEKSRSIGVLATHIADIPARGTSLLETDGFDFMSRAPLPNLNSPDELVALLDERTAGLRAALANAEDSVLDENWSLRGGDRVFITAPKRNLLRSMLVNHIVHHRAQLGVYYRLLGIPVPGVYGPTADEPMV